MAENLGVKIEAILKKLEKLDVIELQLNEVHAKVANIEETVSRLESEVQALKTRTAKLEKNVEELEEGFKYNEEDVRDLQCDNKRLEHEVYDLKKQLLYMETYSRRENLKFFGVPENTECTTKEVIYQFLEENQKIDQPREKIEFQRIHRLGKPNSSKPRPIIARFLRYSDRELVMDNARKHLKGHKVFHVFEDIPKDLYELRKQQMKKLKEAREKGHRAFFSKANLDKLFVNGQYVAPEQPLQ